MSRSRGPRRALQGARTVLVPANSADVEIVTESLKGTGYASDEITSQMITTGVQALADGCAVARQNRQTALMLGGMASATVIVSSVVVARTRRTRPQGSAAAPPSASA